MLIFRNAVRDVFGNDPDKFFTPFIVPHSKKGLSKRELRELDPENNHGIYLVPQILTRSADDFLDTERKLMDLGYDEINLNLGCPSGTVVSKGRGSGLLREADELDRLLYGIFSKTRCRISVKTRIGYEDPYEFYGLLEIFNRYEMEELIIHPRIRSQMYDGKVNMDMYTYAADCSRNTLCYNGDIVNVSDIDTVPGIGDGGLTDAVMIGRGMVRDPSLIRQIKGGDDASSGEIIEFMEILSSGYTEICMDERQVLCKLKEIMVHMDGLLKCDKKAYKKMMKTGSLETFMWLFRTEARRI